MLATLIANMLIGVMMPTVQTGNAWLAGQIPTILSYFITQRMPTTSTLAAGTQVPTRILHSSVSIRTVISSQACILCINRTYPNSGDSLSLEVDSFICSECLDTNRISTSCFDTSELISSCFTELYHCLETQHAKLRKHSFAKLFQLFLLRLVTQGLYQ